MHPVSSRRAVVRAAAWSAPILCVPAAAAPAFAGSSPRLSFYPDNSHAAGTEQGTWALVLGLATIDIPSGVRLDPGQLRMTVTFSPQPGWSEQRMFPSETPIGWVYTGVPGAMTTTLAFAYPSAVTGPMTLPLSFAPSPGQPTPLRRLAFTVTMPTWQKGSFVLVVSAPTAPTPVTASVPWVSNAVGQSV